ncbi:POTRA domain-containing protein [Halanaerocella petrolearia]
MRFKELGIITLVLVLVVANSSFLVAAEIDGGLSSSDNKLSQNVITEIKVVGNKHVSKDEILSQVKTQVGDNISHQKLQKDVQAIFDLGYFFDVRVNFKNHKQGLMLILEVIENPKLSSIKVTGNKNLSKAKVKELLGLDVGQVLNVNRLNKGVEEINKYYQEEGYVLAKVVDVTIKNQDELHLKIKEGKLNKILISGNNVTKDYVIRRELSMKPGHVFNINKMWEDLREIYNLGYFKDVKPKFNKVKDNPQAVNLEIQVKEKKTGTFSVGGGYNGTSGWTGLINIKKDNLFGRGQRVKLNWEFGNKKNTYEIGFYEPWAFGTETSLNFNLYNKEEDRADDVTEKTKGGNITLGRPLTENTKGYVKLTMDREKTEEESEWHDSRSLTLKTIRDTRDNIINPKTGSRAEFSVEKAGILGGDNDFAKYEADLRKYLPDKLLSDGENSWALRMKLGESSGNLTDSEQYYLAGLDGVRGYDNQYYKEHESEGYDPVAEGFVGDSILATNLEYRAEIVDKVTGVGFVDAGRTFNDHLDLEELKDINYSVGLGVRFNTPIGQLGLDYGYAPDAQLEEDSNFSIRIGNRF